MPKVSKTKARKYSIDYLQFGFIEAYHDETRPFCLLCKKILVNDSMKPAALSAHLNTLHAEYSSKPLKFFEELQAKEDKVGPKSIETLFSNRTQNLDQGLDAIYQISLQNVLNRTTWVKSLSCQHYPSSLGRCCSTNQIQQSRQSL